MSEGKVIVWLDCDPGHDDAFAIILACMNPNIDLVGISTVFGNQTVEKTTRNALSILKSVGATTVPVVMGSSRPIIREPLFCPEIHGESGLEGTSLLPEPQEGQLRQEKWIEYIATRILKSPNKVSIVATAALTNVALLLTVYPECKEKISEISLLGGAMGIGNISPVAEFNILIDPEAAKIVFGSKMRIIMTPLEVTHSILVMKKHVEMLSSMKTAFGDMCADLLQFFQRTYKKNFDFDEPPLHDPVALAFLIDPAKFETKYMNVEIETSSVLSHGQTVCDIYSMTGRPANVHVNTKVDVEWFWGLMMDALTAANEKSPINA